MTNFKNLTIALIAMLFVFASCEKEAIEVNDLKSKEVTLSRKTTYGNDWIYYSFEEEKELSGLDETSSKISDSWDIAFNRYNVRTNSGNSGAGEGGAYDAGVVEWASVIEADETGYTVDDTIEIVEKFNGLGVDYMPSNGSSVFKNCISQTYGAPGPTYTPTESVYVMKTAKGKYAKIMITSFYDQDGNSGYISFKYSYQAGDGRKFE